MDLSELLLLSVFLFTLLSAFCSSSESAFFSLPAAWIKNAECSPKSRERLVAKLLKSPQELLVSIFIVNTVANVFVQNNLSAYFGEEGHFLTKILIPFFLLLFLGEIFPKQVGLERNKSFAILVAPVIQLLSVLLAPFRKIVFVITSPLSHLLFFFLRKDKVLGKDEIEHVLESSQERGVIYPEEVELASGYLDFQRQKVREFTTPKEEVFGYEIGGALSKLPYLFIEKKLDEIPVFQKNLDHPLGTLRLSDYLRYRESIKNGRDIVRYLRRPLYVPEMARLKSLLEEMLHLDTEIAFILDEYARIKGIVRRADLFSEILGALGTAEPQRNYQVLSPGVLIADGTWDLDELEEYFGISLRESAVSQTVGGWLVEVLGDIPKGGTSFQKEGLTFQILAAKPNRIKKLLIKKGDLS